MKTSSRLRFESGNRTLGLTLSLVLWPASVFASMKAHEPTPWGEWVPASPLSTGPFKYIVEGVKRDSDWEHLTREERENQQLHTLILTAFCFQSFSLFFPFPQVPPWTPSAPTQSIYFFFLKFLFIYFHWTKQFAFGPFLLGSFSLEICIFWKHTKLYMQSICMTLNIKCLSNNF